MRRRLLLLVLAALLCGGCPNDNGDGQRRGAAEGASNTLGGFVTTPWPQKVAQLSGGFNWIALNNGINGQTTADFRSVVDPQYPGYVIPWLGTHWTSDLATQNVDVVVLTSETNDAQFAADYASQITVTPADVVNQMAAFCGSVPASVTCFVTTVNRPLHAWPVSSAIDNFIVAQNALIAATFPANRVIDFTTGFSDPGMYLFDAGTHLDQDGMNLRANRAYNAIFNYSP